MIQKLYNHGTAT